MRDKGGRRGGGGRREDWREIRRSGGMDTPTFGQRALVLEATSWNITEQSWPCASNGRWMPSGFTSPLKIYFIVLRSSWSNLPIFHRNCRRVVLWRSAGKWHSEHWIDASHGCIEGIGRWCQTVAESIRWNLCNKMIWIINHFMYNYPISLLVIWRYCYSLSEYIFFHCYWITVVGVARALQKI